MSNQSCETCRWWTEAEHDPPSPEGWCRRNAPSPVIAVDRRHEGISSSRVIWPFTDRIDWCGEWAQSKQEVQKYTDLILLGIPDGMRGLLVRNGIETIEQLCKHSPAELLSIKGFGLYALDRVRTMLRYDGLTLAGDTLDKKHL